MRSRAQTRETHGTLFLCTLRRYRYSVGCSLFTNYWNFLPIFNNFLPFSNIDCFSDERKVSIKKDCRIRTRIHAYANAQKFIARGCQSFEIFLLWNSKCSLYVQKILTISVLESAESYIELSSRITFVRHRNSHTVQTNSLNAKR